MLEKITVVGSGFVGFSLAVLMSQKKEITIVDLDKEKLKKINQKISPIKDKNIQEFLDTKKLKLKTSNNLKDSIEDVDLVILALPTNFDNDSNNFDTSIIDEAVKEILSHDKSIPILIKSTVPIGYTNILRNKYRNSEIIFSPEFLREGHALHDNLFPNRIIIGSKNKFAIELSELFLDFAQNKPKIFFMGSDEAESVKLFSNTYLANRVNFFNELDSFAIEKGLDTKSIIDGVTSDERIGDGYHNPSFGYGGYCLPKDSRQLESNFGSIPQMSITATIEGNSLRKSFLASYINSLGKKNIGIYRLIMKKDSDNFRESSIIDLISLLKEINPTINFAIYEPLIYEDSVYDIQIIKSLKEFKDKSELIITNRIDNLIDDVKEKIFSRDIYHEN